MCVLIAINQLGFGGVLPVLPIYAESFGVSQTHIGIAVSIYGLARVIIALPSGHLADSVGRRFCCLASGSFSPKMPQRLTEGPDMGHLNTPHREIP